MSKAKHTPGPWDVVTVGPDTPGDPSRYAITCASDPIGTKANDIAMVWLRGGEEKTSANASLIAAAPELLEALRSMLVQFNFNTITGIVHDESAAIVKAREAIAKATGEQA